MSVMTFAARMVAARLLRMVSSSPPTAGQNSPSGTSSTRPIRSDSAASNRRPE